MSQQNSQQSSPGENGSAGNPEAQSPFQIAGEGSASPFESVGNDSPFGLADSEASKAEAPPADNPFSIAGKKVDSEEGAGGFEMKGFPKQSAPMNELEAAPVAGGASPPPQPLGGMNFPPADAGAVVSARSAAPVAETKEKEAARVEPDFGKPNASTPAKPARGPQETAAAPAGQKSGSGKMSIQTKQLELRAIFGIDHELSENEMLQRARTLPGVRNLSRVRASEMVAIETVRNCISKLGFGDADAIEIACGGGVIDFISSGDASLAVLHEGAYAPGVRETLFIVARELDKL